MTSFKQLVGKENKEIVHSIIDSLALPGLKQTENGICQLNDAVTTSFGAAFFSSDSFFFSITFCLNNSS